MRSAIRWGAVLAGLGVFFYLLGWIVQEALWQAEAEAAERRNAPAVLLDPSQLMVSDPQHVQFADGRKVRLGGVIAPVPGTPRFEQARTFLERGILRHATKVGIGPGGTLWALCAMDGICGNATAAERRRASIPRWRDITPQLIGSGLYERER